MNMTNSKSFFKHGVYEDTRGSLVTGKLSRDDFKIIQKSILDSKETVEYVFTERVHDLSKEEWYADALVVF
jgi:hypothetical protein